MSQDVCRRMVKKYNVRETSILAYCEVLENLGERQQEVYKSIKELKSCSNSMISKYLNLPINCITGRVNELRKRGVVMQSKKDTCPITGKKVLFWKVVMKI